MIKMFWYNECATGKNANKRDDGNEWHADNYYLKAGGSLNAAKFYVLSVVAPDNLKADAFALDRAGNCGYGGVRLCEAILFTGKTNTMERANAIHAYLRKKWKNAGDGADLIGDCMITVGRGATLKLGAPAEGVVRTLKSLGGGGTLDIAEANGVDTVYAAADAAGAVSCTTVNGAVTFADAVTVKLAVADARALRPGVYPILSATSLAGFVAGNFTIDAPDCNNRRTYSLQADATTLKLRVAASGTMVLFR